MIVNPVDFKNYFYFFLLCVFFFSTNIALAESHLHLRDRLATAEKGDYIVVARNKNQTLLRIFDKANQSLILEEITAPTSQIPRISWKEWIETDAPGSSSWVRYKIDLLTGQMEEFYSVTQNCWLDVRGDDLFSKLLNLTFVNVPPQSRKRIGTHRGSTNLDPRFFWHPRMIINGQVIPGVYFDAWRTHWPKDGSELSGKEIEIYLPQDTKSYPSYFPYWLQISGTIGKVSIRIIDSGRF